MYLDYHTVVCCVSFGLCCCVSFWFWQEIGSFFVVAGKFYYVAGNRQFLVLAGNRQFFCCGGKVLVLRTYLVYNTVVRLCQFFCCGGKVLL